jgi:hypothetical protein
MAARATLLETWMPRWDVADRHDVTVDAPAERAFAAARRVDFAASPIVRTLLAIRTLPSIIRGRRMPVSVTLDSVSRAGFVRLAEEPGREIVVGVAGRFWVLSRSSRSPVSAATFAAHAEPGTAKAAMSFWVEPLGTERSRVVTETRVLCADADARRQFLRYWMVIRPGSALIRWAVLRRIKADAESRSATGAGPARTTGTSGSTPASG